MVCRGSLNQRGSLIGRPLKLMIVSDTRRADQYNACTLEPRTVCRIGMRSIYCLEVADDRLDCSAAFHLGFDCQSCAFNLTSAFDLERVERIYFSAGLTLFIEMHSDCERA